MKNFIKSNYNIYPHKIYKKDNKYFFFSNNEKVFIIKTNKKKEELDKIVKVSNELYNQQLEISTFILNVNGEYYTKVDDSYIILLKYNNVERNKIFLDDIIKYNNSYNNLDELNLKDKWKKTIDNIENEMVEYNKEYPVIQESLNYFIGISENAIQMIETVNINNNSIGHDLNINNFNIYELNNPLNLIKTNKMYDIALYYKYKFYNDYIDYEELYIFLKKNNKEDLIVFFCLMLYQNDYFDDVKDILLGKKNETILKKYIDKIIDYKQLIKYIKDNLQNIGEILELEWIDK